jgi:hypothetical protein
VGQKSETSKCPFFQSKLKTSYSINHPSALSCVILAAKKRRRLGQKVKSRFCSSRRQGRLYLSVLVHSQARFCASHFQNGLHCAWRTHNHSGLPYPLVSNPCDFSKVRTQARERLRIYLDWHVLRLRSPSSFGMSETVSFSPLRGSSFSITHCSIIVPRLMASASRPAGGRGSFESPQCCS